MIRLYQRGLQANEAIQELQRRVEVADVLNNVQTGDIKSAEEIIIDLREVLGHTEIEQHSLLQVLSEVEREKIFVQIALDESQDEALDLHAQLSRSEQDAAEKVKLLRKAEQDTFQQRTMVCQSEREVRQRLGQLAQAERKRLEVQAWLESSCRESHDLRGELAESRLDTQGLRGKIYGFEQVQRELRAQVAEEAFELGDLSEKVETLHSSEAELRVELDRRIGVDRKNSKLAEQTASAEEYTTELREKLSGTTTAELALRIDVVEQTRRCEGLQVLIRHSELGAEDMKKRITGMENIAKEERALFNNSDRKYDALEDHLLKYEAFADHRHEEALEHLEDYYHQVYALKEESAQSMYDSEELRQSLAKVELTSSKANTVCIRQEAEKEDLKTAKQDLEEELSQLKQKRQCIVS